MAQAPLPNSQAAPPSRVRRWLAAWSPPSIAAAAVLLIFIVQNTGDVRFHFLFVTYTWPLWFYTILVAVFGAMVWIGLGVARRHRRRKHRRAERGE